MSTTFLNFPISFFKSKVSSRTKLSSRGRSVLGTPRTLTAELVWVFCAPCADDVLVFKLNRLQLVVTILSNSHPANLRLTLEPLPSVFAKRGVLGVRVEPVAISGA